MLLESLRGYESIAVLYQRIFTGPAAVWVELEDLVEFQTGEMVVLHRTRDRRVFQYFGPGVGWRQNHHHGFIDDLRMLSEYQQAVRGA